MEHEGSVLHLQESATCPYPEPGQFSPYDPSPILFLEDPFKYILASVPRSPKWKKCHRVVYLKFVFAHSLQLE